MPSDNMTRPTTEDYRRHHGETFPRQGLTRDRWLLEARPDESLSEWRERMDRERGIEVGEEL